MSHERDAHPAHAVHSASDREPLILYDGVCKLCHAAVRFVLARDRQARFRFAALDSPAARARLAAAGVPRPEALGDSVVLIDGAGIHVRSTAALRIARALGFPWSLAFVAIVVPRPLRDALYDAIARRRYRWFGRDDACPVPPPDVADRFLDAP